MRDVPLRIHVLTLLGRVLVVAVAGWRRATSRRISVRHSTVPRHGNARYCADPRTPSRLLAKIGAKAGRNVRTCCVLGYLNGHATFGLPPLCFRHLKRALARRSHLNPAQQDKKKTHNRARVWQNPFPDEISLFSMRALISSRFRIWLIPSSARIVYARPRTANCSSRHAQ